MPRAIRGFSLIELLVVMGVIALLSGIGAAVLRDFGGGLQVAQAVDRAAAMVQNARLQARLSGIGAKLVIDADPGSASQLQRMAVFVPDFDQSKSVYTGNWVMSGSAVTLPKGVFMLKDYSSGLGNERFAFDSGGSQDGARGNACLVVNFDGQGLLDTAEGARMVFSRALKPDSAPPETMLAGRRGILLRKYGNPAPFQLAQQMLPTTSP